MAIGGTTLRETSSLTGVHLRPARPADAAAVGALFAALHRYNAALDARFSLDDGWEALLRAHFARTCETPGALWLLAWDGPRPVGLLVMEAHRDSPLFRERAWAELVALYVAPSWRGAGLATRLLERARAWTEEQGFDRLQLYVTATNEPARRLYRRCGLRPVQEIWRLEVTPCPGVTPPEDPSCPAEPPRGDLLEAGHHHLAAVRAAHDPAQTDASGLPDGSPASGSPTVCHPDALREAGGRP